MSIKWKNLSLDPNSRSSIKTVNEFFSKIITPIKIKDRDDFILNYIKGMNVLDIGIAEHTEKYIDDGDWFFAKVVEKSSNHLGLDINCGLVDYIKKKFPYNVICHDATVNKKIELFDIVHCGDVIEHVSNVDGLINFIIENIKNSGRIIISTPNVFYCKNTLQNIFKGNQRVNLEHISWISPTNINELCNRYELTLEKIILPLSKKSYFLSKLINPLRTMAFSNECIYILKKDRKAK